MWVFSSGQCKHQACISTKFLSKIEKQIHLWSNRSHFEWSAGGTRNRSQWFINTCLHVEITRQGPSDEEVYNSNCKLTIENIHNKWIYREGWHKKK